MRTVLLTCVAMLAFAANSLLCRAALRDTGTDPASFTAIRLASGALVLWVLVRVRGGGGGGGSWGSAAALFAYAACFSFAYGALTAGTGALLLFGAVQAGTLGHALWSGTRLRAVQGAGLLLAAGGLLVLVLPGLAAPPPGPALLMAAAGLAWAVYGVRGRAAADPTAATEGNFVRTLPLAALLAAAAARQVDGAGAALAVLSGAVASGLGYAVWYAALPALPAAVAGTVQLSVPAITAVLAVALLAEPYTPRLLAATLAILGGIALVTKRARRP